MSERTFFPETQGLPENLNKASFTQQFKQVDSPQYKELLNQIDQRIASLPMSQLKGSE